jgi:hypothetical protein
MAGYKPVRLEGGDFQSVAEAAAFYSLPQEEEPEASTVDMRETSDRKGKYDKFVTITRTSPRDDSIAVYQMRLALKKTEYGWDVRTAGERWKCARSKNADKWITKPCP